MRVVVMGVTGSGKTTVGLRLAEHLGADFIDGDELHSPRAVAKMSANVPLTDQDRWPWLERVGRWLGERPDGVVACSALKRSYRDAIRVHAPQVVLVHLEAPQSVLEERVRLRAQTTGHFAGPGLLNSQFEALEPLEADELGVEVDVARHSPEDAALAARAAIDAARR